MSVDITELQQKFINDIAIQEGFKCYKVDFSQGSLKGDGYMGMITLVKIEEVTTKKALHLVLKTAQQGEELREKTPVLLAYHRENYMYKTIFKEFSELQKEYKVKHVFDGIARYYGGLNDYNEECLALENLKEIGFILWNRKKPMDSHHVGAVMAQYGKFHALSYAMRKLKPEKYAEVTKNLNNIFEEKSSEEELQSYIIMIMDKAIKAMEGKVEATTALKRFMEDSSVFFKQTLKQRDKYTVIMHGDCWCNNMMFKYEDQNTQKPSKVCLLDWQISSLGSPVQDISYFFFACSSKLCMDNFNSFLKIYHDSLSDMLKQFAIEVDEIMSFEDLQMQWRLYAKYGMYVALLIIKTMLTEQEEAPDIRDVSKGEKNIFQLFDVDISNNEEYNKRVSDVIDHMVRNRLI